LKSGTLRPRPLERSRPGRARRIIRYSFVALIVAAIAIVAIPPVRTAFLLGLGNALVNAGAPEKADAIGVIGGDQTGRRILLAAKLAQEGYASKVYVTGVRGIYGYYESDLAIDFAVKHGFSRDLFVPIHKGALATTDEARDVMLPVVRKAGAHKFLLVTSEFHTARAGRIYRREAPDMKVVVVAADTPYWDHGYWWKDREGQKIWFTEVEKTLADWFRF